MVLLLPSLYLMDPLRLDTEEERRPCRLLDTTGEPREKRAEVLVGRRVRWKAGDGELSGRVGAARCEEVLDGGRSACEDGSRGGANG